MDMLKGLNPAQRIAVEVKKGPLLILAGAGSGKTRVLTHRVAYLIREKQVAPYRIMAVTFTNRAAGEMKKRIGSILGMDVKGLWTGTFHSIFLRILRRELPSIGREGDFVIYDAGDQLSLIKECFKELDIDDNNFRPKSVLSAISQAKCNAVTPEKFQQGCKDFYSEKVAVIYQLYQERLKLSKAFDFDDLLCETIKLFKDYPAVLSKYQELFHEVLVDEFQDTNKAQYLLLRLLTSKRDNLWAVGDDDQSIYSWRGAEIRNILDLERNYPDLKVLKLEQNYRSTRRILAAANSLIEKNGDRLGKQLWTDNPEGEKVVYRKSANERHEVLLTGKTIVELVKNGDKRYRDIVLFYRTNAQSRVIEEGFMRLNIPYTIIGGVKFYERLEIKDTLAYLRLIANPEDSVSLRRIINKPLRGIGKATLDAITLLSVERGIPPYMAIQVALQEGILSRGIEKRVKGFVSLIEGLRARSKETGLHSFVKFVLDSTGYLRMWEEDLGEGRTRVENLKEFVSAVKEFEDMNEEDGALQGFLDRVSLITGIDLYEDKDDIVSLMTLHSAKGLEFPVVFILGMEEGLFPHFRSLEESSVEEERRLFYVGMTRAKEKVYLSGTEERTIFGMTKKQRRSRFISDIIPSYLQDETPFTSYYVGENTGGPGTLTVERPVDSYCYEEESQKFQDFLDIGHRVRHPSFGVGIIKRMEGKDKLTVLFQSVGLKKLVLPYASLERVG
ncbi:MAG: ATP-dependent helicase [Thermodesulfobacteriota bacterium]